MGQKSDADFIVLGGDFNVDPKVNAHETTYHDIKKIMTNSIEEFFKHIEDWLIPKKASYANPQNTYSHMYKPVLYDYIFHRGTQHHHHQLLQYPVLEDYDSPREE